MNFRQSTTQHAEQKYTKMLDRATPSPYTKGVVVDSSGTYSSKRDSYYSRLSREKNEFNKALKEVKDAEAARLGAENERLEAAARAKYRIFKTLKILTFLLPILMAAITGVEIFSQKALFDQMTDVPYIFFWVVFSLVSLIASIRLITSLNNNQIYYNRNHISESAKYTTLAIVTTAVVLGILIFFFSLTGSILPQKHDFVFVERGGEYYLTGYTGNSPLLVLPEDYEGQSYRIAEGAFQDLDEATSVRIPEKVLSIDNDAFDGCNLTSITILNKDIELRGSRAFGDSYDNKNIEYIEAPTQVLSQLHLGNALKTAIVTGGETVPANAFKSCYSIETLKIASSVTLLEAGAFNTSLAPTHIDVPAYALKIIGSKNFETVVINTGYNILDNSFSGASKLTSVKLPNTLQTIGEKAFYNCTSLTSVEIPSGVISIGANAFYNCPIESISIPNGVTVIPEQAFAGTALKAVEIPESVTEIGTYAFSDCTALKTVEISEGVTDIGTYAFSNCTSLESVSIPSTMTKINERAFKNCSSLKSIEIPKNVTEIGSSAFYGCSSLTSVVVPESVTAIGYGAFCGCNSLVEITLPFIGKDYSPAEVRWTTFGYIFGDKDDDGYMSSSYSSTYKTSDSSEYTTQNGYYFYIPDSLKKVTITNQSTVCDYAFANCDLIETIEYSNDITSLGKYAFSNCGSIEQIPDLKITSIPERAFSACYALTSIEIPEDITEIGTYAFSDCSTLTSIVLPVSLGKIYSYAFSNCTSLESLVIPKNVTEIGTGAFSGCTAVTEIAFNASTMNDLKSSNYVFYNVGKEADGIKLTIGNSVTKIPAYLFYPYSSSSYAPKITSVSFEQNSVCQSIGNYAFNCCSSLVSIVFPTSLTEIGYAAFTSCTSLTTIDIPSSVKYIGAYAFQACSSLTTAIFAVPSGWFRTSSSTATSGTVINNLGNTSTAAQYLKSTYYNYYWKRS